MPNAAELAFASWQAETEKEAQRNVMLARHYYEGEHETFLTDRLREFLNAKADHEFNLNVVRQVVDVVAERLIVLEMGTAEDNPADGSRTPLRQWADGVWTAADLDVLQADVHEGTGRDGEFFILVDWDVTTSTPRLTPHQRFADPQVGGDGFGCKAHYPNDDTRQPMAYASKRWIETLDNGKARSRMNLYYPDRVEKYEWSGGAWVPYRDADDTGWPVPWVRADGSPRGIPVVHFRNTFDVRPEAWDAIPLQRAINKALIDLMATGDMTAFRIFTAFGFQPTSDGMPLKADGSNAARLGPAQIIGTHKSPSEAAFNAIDGADVTPIIGMLESLIGWLAVVTSTPKSRLTFGRQVAAEGTLQEMNEGLFAKCRKRQLFMDRAWVRCFEVARILANDFAGAGLDEALAFVAVWEAIQSRDTYVRQSEWKAKKELGIPMPQIWSEMGYTSEQIAAMETSEEYQAYLAMLRMNLTAPVAG